MGKRELVIILAFVLIGAGVYQLTVVHRGTDRPFSFATAIQNMRPGSRRERATSTLSREGTLAVDASVAEIRIAGLSTATLIGEDRTDVRYELAIEASGSDEVAARALAERLTVDADRAGAVLAVALRGMGNGGRFTVAATIRVPRHLMLTIEGTRTADIRDVQSVYLHRMTGDAHLEGIRALVSGSHRNGKLTMNDIGRVDLTLLQSDVEITSVHDGVRLSMRNGSAQLTAIHRSVDVDGDSYRATIADPDGAVRFTGADAEVHVDRPRGPVRGDMRRSRIAVELDRAAAVVIATTEKPLKIQLDADLPVTINARALDDGGRIDASAFGLSPETHGGEARLLRRVGDAAEIVLRNQRAEIEITTRK